MNPHTLHRITEPAVFGVRMWVCTCGCRFTSEAAHDWHVRTS